VSGNGSVTNEYLNLASGHQGQRFSSVPKRPSFRSVSLKGEGKAIAIEVWIGPYGSGSLELPESLDNRQMKGQLCQSYELAAFNRRRYPRNSFLLEDESTQGPLCGAGIKTLKNSSHSIRKRTRNLPACSAVTSQYQERRIWRFASTSCRYKGRVTLYLFFPHIFMAWSVISDSKILVLLASANVNYS
jgi:hypothetical protein